ncbi:MAG TPA: TlpA disulfide reductase family protein [Methylomirabilota bacterium]|jgi:peroxiredoxin|nr:TlpA disulfide reductase family protein [Methylomirabilota bacterium]
MRSHLALTAVIVAIVALLVGGAVVALRSSTPTPDSAAEPSTAAPPAPAPAPPAVPPKPRAGRQLSVEEAIKELDLIRPSRTKTAEDFTAPLLGGKSFRLSQHRGQPVLINFWATWCPPCREEMPSMERLWRQHQDSGFVMLAISLDADPKVVPPFVTEHKFTFQIALDPKLDVANAYGVRALPASFLVDRRGNLAALALGPRTWDNDAAHSLIEGLMRQ